MFQQQTFHNCMVAINTSISGSTNCYWSWYKRLIHATFSDKSWPVTYELNHYIWSQRSRFPSNETRNIKTTCQNARKFDNSALSSNWSISTEIKIWTPTFIMHLLVFFSPLVESLIIFFRQLIRTVVKIILLVSHFSYLLSRSFRSISFTFQNLRSSHATITPLMAPHTKLLGSF